MPKDTLLHEVWSGRIRVRIAAAPPDLGLSHVITLPPDTLYLDRAGTGRAEIYEAGEDLEPGLTLADVLAEEFGIFAGDRTLVVLVPEARRSARTGAGWAEPLLRTRIAAPRLPAGAHVHQP